MNKKILELYENKLLSRIVTRQGFRFSDTSFTISPDGNTIKFQDSKTGCEVTLPIDEINFVIPARQEGK